jgi:hypothetical protein
VKRAIIGIGLAMFLAFPAAAQEADLQTRLDAVAKLGKEINDHDQAAWHVTDALVAAKLPGLGQMSFGFFTERVDAETVRAGFVEYSGDDYRVVFTGLVKGSTVVSTQNLNDTRPSATARQIAMIKGQRAMAERYPQGLCGARPNSVILPSAKADDSFDLYVLSPETRHGIVQIGGHEHTTLDASGKLVSDPKPYNAGCLSIDRAANAEMIVTTLRPDAEQAPTEMHVFKSLSHEIPIYVVGTDIAFLVDGDRITPVTSQKQQ